MDIENSEDGGNTLDASGALDDIAANVRVVRRRATFSNIQKLSKICSHSDHCDVGCDACSGSAISTTVVIGIVSSPGISHSPTFPRSRHSVPSSPCGTAPWLETKTVQPAGRAQSLACTSPVHPRGDIIRMWHSDGAWERPAFIPRLHLAKCPPVCPSEGTLALHSKQEAPHQAVTSTSRQVFGWVLLCLTVFCFALMAPVGRLIEIPIQSRLISSILLTGWRTTVATLFLAPIATISIVWHGLDDEQRQSLRDPWMWLGFMVCGTYQAVGGCGYNAAITYTTIPQAVLFTNLHPVLIILHRFVYFGGVKAGEWVGVIAAMLGTVLVVGGQVAHPAIEPANHQITYTDMLLGDAFGFITSVTFCLVLTSTKTLRRKLPVILFLTIQMGIGSLITFLIALLTTRADFSSDAWHGLFGFAHSLWAVPVLFGSVLMLIGWFGASAVTKFLAPLVVSTFLALEPATAVMLGVLLGVEGFPSWVTVGGICIMLVATALVAVSAPQEGHEDEPLLSESHATCESDLGEDMPHHVP